MQKVRAESPRGFSGGPKAPDVAPNGSPRKRASWGAPEGETRLGFGHRGDQKAKKEARYQGAWQAADVDADRAAVARWNQRASLGTSVPGCGAPVDRSEQAFGKLE